MDLSSPRMGRRIVASLVIGPHRGGKASAPTHDQAERDRHPCVVIDPILRDEMTEADIALYEAFYSTAEDTGQSVFELRVEDK
jgi:hypothetical protein